MQIMRRTLRRRPSSLVIDLRRRDVPMTGQILHLANIHPGIEQNCGRRRPQRMRGVNTDLPLFTIRQRFFLHCAGQPLQIMLDEQRHRDRVHHPFSKPLRVCPLEAAVVPEERPSRRPMSADVPSKAAPIFWDAYRNRANTRPPTWHSTEITTMRFTLTTCWIT